VLESLSATATAVTVAEAPRRGKPLVIAHRGASAYAPENTLAAIRKAIELDADLVEIDVQQTADGELVVIHDTELPRTSDVEELFPDRAPWNVADFTLAELRTLDVGSWFGPEYAGEQVPTLGAVLDLLQGTRCGLLLEVKKPARYPGIGQHLAAELAAHPGWLCPGADRLVVQSFDREFVRAFHELLPAVPNGLLGAPAVGQLDEIVSFADLINPRHIKVDADWVARVHTLGPKVYVWTVNGPDAMRRAVGLGVDGIITDCPDVLLEVLGESSLTKTVLLA